MVPGVAQAANGYPYDSSADAEAACRAMQAAPGGGQTVQTPCATTDDPSASIGAWVLGLSGGTNQFKWGLPTEAECLAKPAKVGPSYDVGVKCSGGCEYSPEGGNEIWSVRGTDGAVRRAGSTPWKPTGNTCGATLPPIPPVITKLCGGGSCMDTNTGMACATAGGGQQVCVKVKPPQGGECASGGDTTLCAGNPPPQPPNPPISDPPGQIGDSDKFGHDKGDGSPITNTTINNYNNAGNAPNNGANPDDPGTSAPPKKGDSGGDPAPGSSSAGAGSYGGGGDCNTPPVCTGDAVMCGIARQEWTAMCQAKGDADASKQSVTKLFGDGTNPPETPPMQGADGLWVPTPAGTGDVGDAANNGSYDTTGLGFGNTCPLHDLEVPIPGGSFSIPFGKGCDFGGWLRAIILAFATFAAAKITAGGIS